MSQRNNVLFSLNSFLRMKFGLQLRLYSLTKWSGEYIKYDKLKDKIRAILKAMEESGFHA